MTTLDRAKVMARVGDELASLAQRIASYADEPGITEQKRDDLKQVADMLMGFAVMADKSKKPGLRSSSQ